MKAMILAAGRGERMRPLTDHTPKPLLAVGGKPLIVWHIEKLVQAGFHDIVINAAWLSERLIDALGTGEQFGAQLTWSVEDPPLETAGGIARALPALGDAPFLVINGDIWCDCDIGLARHAAAQLQTHAALAWLMLVPNPAHHPRGDFSLDPQGWVHEGSDATARLTFSGLGVYDPALFRDLPCNTPAPLAPLLRQAMVQKKVLGSLHTGLWMDIGTPGRLQQLDTFLGGSPPPPSIHAC